MRTKSSNKLGIFVRNGIPVVSSRDVAKLFNKEHKNVLRDIDKLDCSPEFTRLNFEPCTYRNQKNVSQREYIMTKDGCVFLVMGFTGKEAALFKEQYIAAFNEMVEFIKNRTNMKISFRPMTDAIQEAHEDPKSYHYTNEINMIYRIILGMDAKHYRDKIGLTEDDDLRDHITNEQKKLVDKFQITNTGLIIVGKEYSERKELLTNLFSKYQSKHQNPPLLC
jgi:Rha family phage regulatory protein